MLCNKSGLVVQLLPPWPTLRWSANIWTLRLHILPRAFTSSRWSWKLPGRGHPRRRRSWIRLRVVWPFVVVKRFRLPRPDFSKKFGCWYVHSGPVLFFVGGLPWQLIPRYTHCSVARSPSLVQGCARWRQRPGSPLSEPFPFFRRWPFCSLLSSLPAVFLFRPLVVCFFGFLFALAAVFFSGAHGGSQPLPTFISWNWLTSDILSLFSSW